MTNLFNDNFTGKYEGDPYVNTPLKFLTANSIIGDKVVNNENENMGKIYDIMLDIRSGNIEYYVVEFGGVVSMC